MRAVSTIGKWMTQSLLQLI